jgi:hypothetical protein
LWVLNALAGWRKVEISREQGLPQPGSDDPQQQEALHETLRTVKEKTTCFQKSDGYRGG